MAWIRAEDLQGQEILDEVFVIDTHYVEIEDNKDSAEKNNLPGKLNEEEHVLSHQGRN